MLTFGDVLDETMLLFRQHWITFALVSAVSLIPPGLLVVWLSATGVMTGPFSAANLQGRTLAQDTELLTQLPPLLASSILGFLFELLWVAAIVSTTQRYVSGQQPELVRLYARALRRLPVVVLSALVFGLGLTALSVVGTLLLVLTLFGVVGSVVAGIALLFWWLRKGARKSWVKWLIICMTPYGLPVYFSVRWSMFLGAAVLEGRGPLAALRRSSALVDQHTFRALAVLTVSGVIVAILIYAPAALVDIPLAISASRRGELGFNATESTISSAANVALQIFFASIGSIAYSLLFFDLRNRREGADLVERLTQLESTPIGAHG